jgi:diguanylate cyclase (GGDEF)-like protein/PAS domain S-box-containing protein
MNNSEDQRSLEWAKLEKYWRVFHATPDYVSFSTLETGIFIDVNPAFEKMIGYTREEVIGRSSSSIDLWVNTEDRDAAVAKLRNPGQIAITTHMRTRSGEQIMVEAALASFNMNGEMLLVAVIRDVTARRREEAELQQYRTQLEQLVEQRTIELEHALRRVNELAVQDDLTGVGNRRDLNHQLLNEWQLFDRNGQIACIVIMDLDGLKSVNDAFGHSTGDMVIKTFAQIIQGEMRVTDYLARYGGDEFVLLLRATTSDAAKIPLHRLRDAVERYQWSTIKPGMALTTSIGVASFQKNESVEETFDNADKALYKAKLDGRNRIVFASDILK